MRNYVVWVHGIGKQTPGDYKPFEDAIRASLARQVLRRTGQTPPPDAVVWEDAYWAKVTQDDQDKLKRILGVEGTLRTLLVDSLGDAIAYSRVAGGGGKYAEVQGVFAQALDKLSRRARELEGPEVKVPLTVIGHSLGSVIATGTLDDLRATGRFPANLELKHLFTLGSPIAVYGLRYGLDNFKPRSLMGHWVNYYYGHDMIGYPLQPLGGPWASAVRNVKLSSSGGVPPWERLQRSIVARIWFYRNIKTHSWYFTDSRVVDAVAASLAGEWAPGR